MIPPTHAGIKNKTVEKYLETWKDESDVPLSEKSYKQYLEYDFILVRKICNVYING